MKNKLKGIVVSDKQDKTVVVEITDVKKHPRYEKRYEVNNKFKAHDEDNEMKEGDEVVIEETRPISKEKRWKVVKKIKS